MKISFEVDCTPEEARQFLGLPDVKPLQAAALERLQTQLGQTASAFAPEALLKTWLSFVPQSPEQLRDVLANLFRPPSPRPADPGGGSSAAPRPATGRSDPADH